MPVLKMKKNTVSLAHCFGNVEVIILFFLFSYLLANLQPKPFRYLYYLLPWISLLFIPQFWKQIRSPLLWKTNSLTKHYLKISLAITTYSVLLFWGYGEFPLRFFKEAYFITSPLIFTFVVSKLYERQRLKRYLKLLFWGLVISYFIITHQHFLLFFNREIVNPFTVSFWATEHLSSFLFGLFCLYFLNNRNWKYALLSLALTILAFKRIALGGLLVASCFWLIEPWFKWFFKRKTRMLTLIVLANVIGLSLLFWIMDYESLDQFAIQHFGRSVQGLTSGRAKTFSVLIEELGGLSFFGYGLGKCADVLETINHYEILPHSDILKLVLELGPLPFIAWLIAFYWPFLKTPRALIFPIYMNILFFTDNTFIYFEVLTVFYLLAIFTLTKHERTTATST